MCRAVPAFVLALWLLGIPSLGESAALRVSVHSPVKQGPTEPTESLRAWLTVEPAGAGGSDGSLPPPTESLQEVELAVPGTVELEAPVGDLLRLTVRAEGHWAPSQVVWVEPGAEVGFRLQPTGEVIGRIRVPRTERLPDRLTFRPVSVGDEAEHLPSFPCTLEDPPGTRERGFRCEVPAGVVDSALRAPGFASHFVWGLEVPEHEAIALGELELRPGASVVGWVSMVGEGDRGGLDRARIELAPIALGITGGTDLRRRDSLRRMSQVDERGFFELVDVAPGSYRLRVQHPDYAPTILAPLEVFEGRETAIRSLELHPPVRLQLQLSPATDPFGQPWRIELLRRGVIPGHNDKILESRVDDEGSFVATGLDPGLHAIRVFDERGSVWHHESLDLDGELVHWVDLPVERLEAAVYLGEEPLAGAWLYFGGKHGGQRIHRMTNEEGKAYLFLPKKESWIVDIESPGDHLLTRVEDVRVEKLQGQPWAKARFELPDTLLEGEVVGPDGQPVKGAAVRISATDEPSFLVTSWKDGTFEARGRRPGPWTVQARASLEGEVLSSEIIPVNVQEDLPAGPVRLVLKPETEITGLVVDSQGDGVPGAMVLPLVEQPDANLLSTDRRVYTDVSGAFRLLLPGAAETVHLTVFPPGFGVTQVTVSPKRSATVIVPVDPTVGAIKIPVSAPEGEAAPLDDVYLFGRTWLGPRFFLDQWLEAHQMQRPNGELVVPALAPGFYTACYQVPQAIFTGRPPQDADDRCVSGELTPWGELVLPLAVEPPERGRPPGTPHR